MTACSTKPRNGSEQPDAAERSLPNLAASDYLKQIFSRYQTAAAYGDEGIVRLGLERDGKTSVQIAPMHVHYYRTSLWIAAYDARLWTNGSETLGWIADPTSEMHDGQVVVGGPVSTSESGGRPELPRLLSDAILADRMTLGLGGPPPQLEWLFDTDPMARLFDGEASPERIEYGSSSTRENHRCWVVQATRDGDTYRFHIDQERSMIVAIDLPIALAEQSQSLNGWKIRSLELLLKDASFATPAGPLRLRDMSRSELPPAAKFVRSLLPLPPPPIDSSIGSRIKPFSASDLTGRLRLNHRGVDRPLSLWYFCPRLADSDSRDQDLIRTLQTLNTLLAVTTNAAGEALRPIAFGDRKSLLMLQQHATGGAWLLVDDSENQLAQLLKPPPGGYALTATDGRIHWLGSPEQPGDVESLSNILRDTLAGTDVPKQLRDRWQEDRKAYEEALRSFTTDPPLSLR